MSGLGRFASAKGHSGGRRPLGGLSGRLREGSWCFSSGPGERVRGRESVQTPSFLSPWVMLYPWWQGMFSVFFKARAEVFWRIFSGMFQRTFSKGLPLWHLAVSPSLIISFEAGGLGRGMEDWDLSCFFPMGLYIQRKEADVNRQVNQVTKQERTRQWSELWGK